MDESTNPLPDNDARGGDSTPPLTNETTDAALAEPGDPHNDNSQDNEYEPL